MDDLRTVLEKQVLGCVMWIPDAIRAIDLTTEDFRDSTRAKIFAAMLDLEANGDPIDETTVAHRIGGHASVVCELWNTVPTGQNLGFYLVELKKMIAREKKRDVSAEAHRSVLNGADALEAAEALRQKAAEIDSQYTDGRFNESEALINAALDICAAIRERRAAADVLFLGVPWLDRIHRGLVPGDYIVLAARPSCGKTAMTVQILAELAKAGVKTMLISKEMEAKSIAARIISYVSVTSATTAVRQPDRTPEDVRSQILAAEYEVNEICRRIRFVTRSASTPEQISARIREAKAEGVKLVACDYLQLLEVPKAASRNEAVSILSRAWKLALMDAGIPGLMLSQLSRAGEKEGRKPELSDLRDSGSIEQDADYVWFLHRPQKKVSSYQSLGEQTTFEQAKGRNTGKGWKELTFRGDQQRFYEIEHDANE